MRHAETGSADQTIRLWAFDSAGAAVTGLTPASAGIAVTVTVMTKGRRGTPESITLTTRDIAGTHKDHAFTEIGSGEYALDLADSKVATTDTVVTASLAADAITGNVYVENIEVHTRHPNVTVGSLTQAALAQFVTDDTEETSAATGSVSKLAQGGGSGDTSSFSGAAATTINAIKAKTDLLTAALQLTIVSPVSSGGDLSLIRGVDYLDTPGSAITIEIDDVGAVVHARLDTGDLTDLRFGAGRPNEGEEFSGTIAALSAASDVTSIKIEIAGAATASAEPSDEYVYHIRRPGTDAMVIEVIGNLTLAEQHVTP